jgi:hypothetical protein
MADPNRLEIIAEIIDKAPGTPGAHNLSTAMAYTIACSETSRGSVGTKSPPASSQRWSSFLQFMILPFSTSMSIK